MRKLFITCLFFASCYFAQAQTEGAGYCYNFENSEFYLESIDGKRVTGGVISFKNGTYHRKGSFHGKIEDKKGKYICNGSSITIYETENSIVTFKIIEVARDKFEVLRIKFADEGGNIIGYFTKTVN